MSERVGESIRLPEDPRVRVALIQMLKILLEEGFDAQGIAEISESFAVLGKARRWNDTETVLAIEELVLSEEERQESN